MALEPLADDEVRLLSRTVSSQGGDMEALTQVVAYAAGNPLFVEQLVAAVHDGSFSEGVPPTSIQRLLASRVDQLPRDEHGALIRASIEGRLFHRGALVALLDDDGRRTVDAAMLSLARKQFVRPDRSQFPGDDGYRFVHALVRDAAYQATPKTLRAELHERFADWLETQVSGHTADVEEILAYHLESAYRFREALGPVDDATRAIALRAARHLAAAAGRADERWDSTAVLRLLERARPLFGGDPGWLDVSVMYASALADRATHAEALAAVRATIGRAERWQRRDIAWRARLLRSVLQGAPYLDDVSSEAEQALNFDDVQSEAELALDELGPDGDPRTLTAAWRNLAFHASVVGDSSAAERASRRCVEIARHAALPRMVSAGLSFYALAVTKGPTPAAEGIHQCRALLADQQLMTVDRATLNATLASLHAMRGDVAHVRRCIDEVSRLQERRGLPPAEGGPGEVIGSALVMIDDLPEAERWLRAACQELRAHGETGVLSTTVACLGHVVFDSGGDPDEAENQCQESKRLTHPGDTTSDVLWRTLRAKLLTHTGDPEGALDYARAAVDFADTTDWPNITADALVVFATVATAARQTTQSEKALQRATRLYRLKQNSAGEDRARAALR